MKKLSFVILDSFYREIDLLTEDKSVDDLVGKSNKIDELISELIAFKQSLKRGPDRLKNRKETSNLQRAIESLRYFNRKNKKILDS